MTNDTRTLNPRGHISYLITDLEIGGVPLHLLRLCGAMRDRGWSVSVTSLAGVGPVGKSLAESGVAVHSCEGRSGWDVRVLGRVCDRLRAEPPGVVHSLLFHANLAARFAARRGVISPSQLICEIQTVEVERRWHLVVDDWTHRWCRWTVGNSPSVVEHLYRQAGIPRERLRLVAGGIDPQRVRSAAVASAGDVGVAQDTAIVLWVGRLDPVKGLSHLIRAFAQVRERFTNAKLVLVGDGPLRDQLRAEIDQAGLADDVSLLGARRDVPSLLRLARMFAFPSRTEGLPNALLEAMAGGLPIVTTDVPGCHDLVTHEATGLLVPYGDTQALAEAIIRLLVDPSLADRLGAGASRAVDERWNISRTFDEYEALYREIAKDPGEA